MSRTWVPRQMIPESSDGRSLGVCVRRLVLGDGREVSLDDPALADGWHKLEEDGGGPFRWTLGAARLPAGARIISVELSGKHPYWVHRNPPSYPGGLIRRVSS